jgi:hypothetical protein
MSQRALADLGGANPAMPPQLDIGGGAAPLIERESERQFLACHTNFSALRAE